MTPREDAIVTRDNVHIDYTWQGKGVIALLFVHGAFIDKNYWSEQIAYFSPSYTVVAIDLPGHGKSGKNRNTWTVEEFGEDVTEVVRQLNLTKVILIGHSLGGDIVLEAAVADPRPVIGIIGVETLKMAGLEPPKTVRGHMATLLQKFDADFPNAAEYYARQGLLSEDTDENIRKRVINDYRNADPEIGRAILRSSFKYYLRERELLKELPFKLHLIQSDYLSADESGLKKYARSGYRVYSIHSTSHFPMIEIPNVLNKALEDAVEAIRNSVE